MSHELLVMTLRVIGALLIGGLKGLERSFHGRPAGFRTHSLVCVASSLLMLVTVHQNEWMTQVALDAIRTDPTRMAQGIMTDIGFLGAGVIFREGLTVRGLTTAASIWVTASIGVFVGIGFWVPRYPWHNRDACGPKRLSRDREQAAERVLRSSSPALRTWRRDVGRQASRARRCARVHDRQPLPAVSRRGQDIRIPNGHSQP
jgi:MgtC family